MKLNRTKNAIRNTFWGMLYKIIILVFPFVIRAATIKTLGIDYLGLSGLFTSILNMLNLTELGVGTAIVYSMYKPIAENNVETLCALMQFYKKIYRIIGFIVLGLGLVIMPFIDKLINGTVPVGINIYMLYLIYLSNTVVTYFLFAYRTCILNAYQRTDIISKVMIVTNGFMYIMQVTVLVLCKNYYLFAALLPVTSAVTNIISAIYAKKIYPELTCRGKITVSMKYVMKQRITGLMMSKVAYMSRNAFDSIIVSAFLGLTTVAIYNNYYYLVSSVSALMVVLMTSISAGLGNSIAIDSTDKNEKDMYNISCIYLFLGMLCFACFIACFQPFISLWTGTDNLFSDYVMFSFAIYFLAEKLLNVIGQYYDAAGLWWHGKWKGFVEALANLVLNIILCKLYGVNGIVLATVATILFIGFPLTVYYTYKYYYKKSPIRFMLVQYSQIVVYIIFGVVIYLILSFIHFNDTTASLLLGMVIRTIVALMMAVGLTVLIFGRTDEFNQAIAWLRNHVATLLPEFGKKR